MIAAPAVSGETEVRFWLKVDVRGEDECWPWKAAKNEHGYGRFRVPGRGGVYAHRFAYEMVHGPVPAGLYVLHACDVRACVNAAHLFLGTKKENARDMVAKGRHGQTRLKNERRAREELLRDAAPALLEAAEGVLWAHDSGSPLMTRIALEALREAVERASGAAHGRPCAAKAGVV
jgi:hypothetical protein